MSSAVKKTTVRKKTTKVVKPEIKVETKAETKDKYFEAVGRRKSAVARVRIYPNGKGILINDKTVNQYFPIKEYQDAVEIPYKLTHKNHPCSIWVRESLSNYLYLCELGLELCKEYTYRYEKRHKTQDVNEWCVSNKPNIRDIGFTEPPKAMPDEFKVNDVVQSYRNYYMGAKKSFATWKKRDVPIWYLENNLVSL